MFSSRAARSLTVAATRSSPRHGAFLQPSATPVSLVSAQGRGALVNHYSVWDRVRPSLWHPLATMEQSMLELECMTTHMLNTTPSFHVPRMHKDDDEFFKDLLASSDDKHKSKQLKHKETEMAKEKEKSDQPTHAGEGEQQPEPGNQSFSSYSYSSSTLLDENGHRVTSVRRRYEDSTGRLKAVHEREIDGKKVKSVWKRKHKEDEGKHKTVSESTSVEAFEGEWKKTPFGKAELDQQQPQQQPHQQLQPHQEELPEGVKEVEKQSEHLTPGPDFEAAEKAPEKECGEEAEGVTKESHEKTRDQAIAEGAKTQEEETTPPSNASGMPGYS